MRTVDDAGTASRGGFDEAITGAKSATRVVAWPLVDVRVLGQRAAVDDDQRASVGRASRRRFHTDIAARPGLVVDDDGAVEREAELLGRPARPHIAWAAGRTGRDDADRAGGIILGRGIAPGDG